MSVRNVWSVGRSFGVGFLRLEGVITLVHHSLKDVSVVLLMLVNGMRQLNK
jgi:hypothetical protein